MKKKARRFKDPYTLDDYLGEQLKDPGFRKAFEEADLPVRLAIEIAKLREKKGWSQREVARRLGTHQQVLSRIENGGQRNLTVGTLQKIAKALDAELVISFR